MTLRRGGGGPPGDFQRLATFEGLAGGKVAVGQRKRIDKPGKKRTPKDVFQVGHGGWSKEQDPGLEKVARGKATGRLF